MNKIFEKWRGGLIVSCQAPAGSPLAKPEIIAAFAETAEQNGAVGVRIDAPENIRAVKSPLKFRFSEFTKLSPTKARFTSRRLSMQRRKSPRRARMSSRSTRLFERVRTTKKSKISSKKFAAHSIRPLAADVATFEEGLRAAEIGFDAVITTLSGYTEDTKHIIKPDFELVEKLSKKLSIPVICEGRLSSAEDVRQSVRVRRICRRRRRRDHGR